MASGTTSELIQVLSAGDEAGLVRLLAATPALAQFTWRADELHPAVGHWLYVGDTALHLAAALRQVGAARLLLAHGAAPNAANRRGARPLHYACDARPHGTTPDRRTQAAALIALLAQGGAELDARDAGGVAPLHRAVRARNVSAVAALLAAGAPVQAAVTKKGTTALHLATQSTGAGGTADTLAEQLAIIRLLLDHGADATTPDARGKTPRDWATRTPVRALLGG